MLNYYATLGIRENSSLFEIKKAYRILAKKYHPDVCHHDQAKEDFLMIHKAYQVLTDPVTRQQYDQELHSSPQTSRIHHQKAITPYQEDRKTTSSFDWMCDQQFLDLGLLEDSQKLRAEITLTAEEAQRGEKYMLTPPLHIRCPVCQGVYQHTKTVCLACYGTGIVHQHMRVPYRIPSGVYDGMIEHISLDSFGDSDVEVEIEYRVS